MQRFGRGKRSINDMLEHCVMKKRKRRNEKEVPVFPFHIRNTLLAFCARCKITATSMLGDLFALRRKTMHKLSDRDRRCESKTVTKQEQMHRRELPRKLIYSVPRSYVRLKNFSAGWRVEEYLLRVVPVAGGITTRLLDRVCVRAPDVT